MPSLRESNILDPIHHELDSSVFDDAGSLEPVLKEQHRKWIIHEIVTTLSDHGYTHINDWLSLVLTGSLTTYQYSEDSDVDVSLFVDSKHFPEWSRAEMIGIMVDKIDGTKLPGTTHPMQCFVVPPQVTKESLYSPGLRSGYDLLKKEWVQAPEKERAYNVEQEQNADYVFALECADKMERLLRYEPDKAVSYWHQIHHRRRRDHSKGKGDFAQSNIVYKFLANRGLFDSISEASGEYIAKSGARNNYEDLECPHCHKIGNMKYDLLDQTLHCSACGRLTPVGGDYGLRQWGDITDYRSPESFGSGDIVEDGLYDHNVIPPSLLPNLGPRRQGSEGKAKLIYKKFQPAVDHRRGPSGPELPFIYVPEHDTVYLGPPGAYHHDLISSSKALKKMYDPEKSWKEPAGLTPEGVDHAHGRMSWSDKTLHFIGDPARYEQHVPRIENTLEATYVPASNKFA